MILQVLVLFAVSGTAIIWFVWDELRRSRVAVSARSQGLLRMSRDPEPYPDQRLRPAPLPLRSPAQSEIEHAFLQYLAKTEA